MSNLYERILEICKNRNMTMAQMIKKSGISRSIMTELKAGRTKTLSADTVYKISSVLNIPADILVDLGEPNPADIPPEPPISESQLLFALYGEVPEEIDKEDIEDIKKYADMVRLRKIAEKYYYIRWNRFRENDTVEYSQRFSS